MPEISKKYIPKHKGDANPNPKLLKFVTKVTDRIPAKMKGVTTEDPEYWGLAPDRKSTRLNSSHRL